MVVTIVTLALGIGATSAIFSVVNGVLLRPLPFPHSDRVVMLMEQTKRFPEPRFRTVLLTLFAGIALAVAGIGIFSVMAYTVTQRTREIGVRVALGASRNQIFGLTLGYTLRLTAIGAVIGMAAAFVLTRYVSAFLFQVPTYDLVTLGGSAIVIVLVAIAASYLPARRATGIDPAKALRQN